MTAPKRKAIAPAVRVRAPEPTAAMASAAVRATPTPASKSARTKTARRWEPGPRKERWGGRARAPLGGGGRAVSAPIQDPERGGAERRRDDVGSGAPRPDLLGDLGGVTRGRHEGREQSEGFPRLDVQAPVPHDRRAGELHPQFVASPLEQLDPGFSAGASRFGRVRAVV